MCPAGNKLLHVGTRMITNVYTDTTKLRFTFLHLFHEYV